MQKLRVNEKLRILSLKKKNFFRERKREGLRK
jgi:hypothetical protein